MSNSPRLGTWADDPCFYVTVIEGPNRAAVAGPFITHASALAAVDAARIIGIEVDPKSVFYAWGTARFENGYREGRLNAKMAELDQAIYRGEWPHTIEHVLEAQAQQFEAQLQKAQFPTEGNLAVKFWEWSNSNQTPAPFASQVMARCGYRPFEGYPLQRAARA